MCYGQRARASVRRPHLWVRYRPAVHRCRVTFEGMASIYGRLSAAELTVRALVGDANRDGWVSRADASSVKQRLGDIAPSCP